MKAMSIAELTALRDKMKDKVAMREGSGQVRVVVGMATCGIAAGARPVLAAFVEKVGEAGLGEKIEGMVAELYAGPGAVRKTLDKYVRAR